MISHVHVSSAYIVNQFSLSLYIAVAKRQVSFSSVSNNKGVLPSSRTIVWSSVLLSVCAAWHCIAEGDNFLHCKMRNLICCCTSIDGCSHSNVSP